MGESHECNFELVRFARTLLVVICAHAIYSVIVCLCGVIPCLLSAHAGFEGHRFRFYSVGEGHSPVDLRVFDSCHKCSIIPRSAGATRKFDNEAMMPGGTYKRQPALKSIV